MIRYEHIEHSNEGFVINPDLDLKKFYPNIWRTKEMEYSNFKKKFHKSYEVDDDILRRAVNKHTKIEILSQAKTFHFSDEMDDLFHDFIYSILIECFFNNPDHWYEIKEAMDLDFKIEVKANWSKDPEIFNRLLNRKNKNLKDNYLHPFAYSVFHNWANEDKRKEILKNKTEQDLFNKVFTEDQLRKERIERYKQKVRRLKPIYLAQLEKEFEKIKSGNYYNYCPYCSQLLKKTYIKDQVQDQGFSGYVLLCDECDFYRRLDVDVDSKNVLHLSDELNIIKKNIENENIDFEEDVILHWSIRGKPVFDDRDSVVLMHILRIIKREAEFNNDKDQKEWRNHWEDVIKSGNFRNEPRRSFIEKELRDKLPENITIRDLIEIFQDRYPEEMKKIEEQVDYIFALESIRNFKKNKKI